MYYFLPQPPYFLVVVGLFVSITCGLAFEAVLKQKVNEWSKNRSTRSLAQLQGTPLVLPFVGICIGTCLFLASGFEVFVYSRSLSYLISLPMTVGTAVLVWSQLGKVLAQIERGGSKALDLDSF